MKRALILAVLLGACHPGGKGASSRRAGSRQGDGERAAAHEAASKTPASWTARPDGETFLRQSGANLPWISYGHDVGWPPKLGSHKQMGFHFFKPLIPKRTALVAPMATLRVWALADNRAGALGPEVQPGFTRRCVRDLSAFMEATPDNATVIWVLYDFMIADGPGSPWGGRRGEARRLFVNEQGWREAWRRVGPCLSQVQKRYGHRILWDIINEPLNGRRMVVVDDDLEGLRGFVWTHMRELLALGGRVSLGVRDLGSLRNVWTPTLQKVGREIRRLGLTPNHLVVQLHHYPGQELHRDSALAPLAVSELRQEMGLHRDTPVLLGECWPTSGFTLADYFEKGFAGVLHWQDAKLKLPKDEVKRQIQALLSRRKGAFGSPPEPHVKETKPREAGKPGPKPDEGALLAKVQSLPLATCERVTDGAPADGRWARALGWRALAFLPPKKDKQGVVTIPMDVEVPRWSRKAPFWTGKKRKGEVLCRLGPSSGGEAAGAKASPSRGPKILDLTDTTVEVVITPPVEAVAHPWGSGAQVVLQDAAGRRLHGPWTGLSKIAGGRKATLRFRPAQGVAPGMGFRHQGFRLDRVVRVGFLWAVGTFATVKFEASMKLHRITLRPTAPADSSKTTRKAPEVGRGAPGGRGLETSFVSWRRYRTYFTSGVNVTRLQSGLELSKCRYTRSDYPYYSGLTWVSSEESLPWRSRPGSGAPGAAPPSPVEVALDLRPGAVFRRGGGISTDLSVDCPGVRGALLDLRGARLTLSTGWKKKGSSRKEASQGPVRVQLTLRDASGVTCYVRKTGKVGHRLSMVLGPGPELCVAGKGVDLKRTHKVGLVFASPRGAKMQAKGVLRVRSLKLQPAGR